MSLWDIEPNVVPESRRQRDRVSQSVPDVGWSPFGPAGRGLGAWRVRAAPRLRPDPGAVPGGPVREVDVLVVGAGQAGLATAYYLQRAGFDGHAPARGRHARAATSDGTYIVLDNEDGPGGAWQHRWNTLTMATVNGIHDLPGAAVPQVDPDQPARRAVTGYFTDYEDTYDLAILRPVQVFEVERADDDPHGRLLVRTSGGTWAARAVIAASGTWNRPFWPYVPGWDTFLGRQLHTRDYRGPARFAQRRVAVVGGGLSAVSHVIELAEVARTFWCTRREPDFRTTEFDAQAGYEVEQAVRAGVERGERPQSVVSRTGIPRTPQIEAARAAGVLKRREMFVRIEPHGLRWADGTFREIDTILWATGFRANLPYLAGLHLHTPQGGIRMTGTQVANEPRLHLVGLGPDSSTIGARRSARLAVGAVDRRLRG